MRTLALHAIGLQQQQGAQQNAPKVKVGSALGAKANSPAPPPTAKNKSQETSRSYQSLVSFPRAAGKRASSLTLS